MNKRIICLLLSLIMLLSVALTGCSTKTDEDIKDDITTEASRNTVTLTMYLMSEEEVSDEQEQKMEEAVNKITKSRFKAKIDLRYFTAENYNTMLDEALAKSQEAKNAGKLNKPAATTTNAGETTPEETVVNEYGVTELKYPDVTDYQVDIFYLNGLEKFDEYMTNMWLTELGTMLTGDAKKVTDYVLPEYFDNFEFIEGGTYAIPNNAPLGEYTYLLVDKTIMSAYNYSATDDFETLTCDNVKDILSKVDRFHRDEFVPLYSSEGYLDLANVQYLGVNADGKYCHDFSVIGGYYAPTHEYRGINNYYPFTKLFDDSKVVDQMRSLVEYKELGYYATEEEADKPFAVGYVKGGAEVAEKYSDKYDVIVLEKPRMSTSDVYDNMFAVSTFSSDAARSMEVITYLNTNVEFRNLLLYGIENENYKVLETEIDGVVYKTVERLNNNYMMDAIKTGNVMISYPLDVNPETGEKELPNIREYQKRQNLDAMTELDFGFKLNFAGEFVNVEAMKQVRALSDEIYADLMKIETTEEFDKFINGYVDPENEENNILSVRVRIENDKYVALMTEISYSTESKDYADTSAVYGEGTSFLYLYHKWLSENGIYVLAAGVE